MKSIPLIYQGPLPAVQVEISQGAILEAKRHGAPVLVSETIAAELLARGDFIEATQTRASGSLSPSEGERAGVRGQPGAEKPKAILDAVFTPLSDSPPGAGPSPNSQH